MVCWGISGMDPHDSTLSDGYTAQSIHTFVCLPQGSRKCGRNIYQLVVAVCIDTQRSFRNIIKSIGLYFTIFRLIRNQADVHLCSKSIGKYNLISGWFNKISEIFLCVQTLGGNVFSILINLIQNLIVITLSPIDLLHPTRIPFAVPNLSEKDNFSLNFIQYN